MQNTLLCVNVEYLANQIIEYMWPIVFNSRFGAKMIEIKLHIIQLQFIFMVSHIHRLQEFLGQNWKPLVEIDILNRCQHTSGQSSGIAKACRFNATMCAMPHAPLFVQQNSGPIVRYLYAIYNIYIIRVWLGGYGHPAANN